MAKGFEVDRIEIVVHMAVYGYTGEKVELTVMAPKGRVNSQKFLKHLKTKIVQEIQSTLEYGEAEGGK